jgi:hypothetical protein
VYAWSASDILRVPCERVRFVRAIRPQLERLRDHVPKANYSALLGASNSL